ncbi:YpiF family protein [Bacillus sp. EB106-08-02-XG196]|uniref:YpiF family protein n=1 Tax=Bacillus sp. EB106-08-02-XG196 TaxID=2737049 RepID=UPI0015C488DF|nr:YpiF family protein [Bacillus sp. EB106-08-02-XG196]NWQ39799.1 YpiF family protein [Bacillus sp. EB106-08-02-XG196]
MKWVSKDIETYLTAKEYVDTAVIPLYSVSFGNEMKQSASSAEFITLLTSYLERQFTGRLLLLPPFTYLKSDKPEDIIKQMKKWEENIKRNEFKHIFYITSESDWKIYEKELAGSLIWLPSLPLEHLNDQQKISMIESQVKQLLSLFTQKWSEKE